MAANYWPSIDIHLEVERAGVGRSTFAESRSPALVMDGLRGTLKDGRLAKNREGPLGITMVRQNPSLFRGLNERSLRGHPTLCYGDSRWEPITRADRQ